MKPFHWKILISIVLIILSTLYAVHSIHDMPTASKPVSNIKMNPVYSDYQFNNNDTTINLGVQPLYVPASLIAEVMKRDTILVDELSNLGIKIHFYNFLKGDDINFFLQKGDLDGGMGGDMPTLSAAASLDIVILSLIQKGFVSIVANQQMLIENLKGKRIGYAFGSNAHYALLRILATAGLSEHQVILVPMEVTEMPEALNNGDITAFSAWEPTPSVALKKYPNSTIIHQRISLGFFYFLDKLYKDNPKALSHIIAAEIRAINWLQAEQKNLFLATEWNISECRLAFGTRLNFSVNDFAAIAMNDIIGLPLNPFVAARNLKNNGPLHKEFQFLINIKKIPMSVSWPVIQNKFRPDILKSLWAEKENFRLNVFNYANNPLSP